MKSKLNSITQVQGLFSNCGPGIDAYELSYNCRGPGCTAISGFQNVICNSDSHGMTCSNNIKCPGGTSSLQSNFTFEQNELDPWSPNWSNQQDILVPQQQDIAISDCARFSLTSDGTSDGTQIDVGDLTGCPRTESQSQSRPQKTPIALAEAGASIETSSLNSGSGIKTTGRPQLQQSSIGTRNSISRSTIFLATILAMLLFSPGTHAASSNPRKDNLRIRPEFRMRQVSDKVRVFANGLSADLANIANAPAQNAEVFAHNLVANVVTSVCIKYYEANSPDHFTPVVVQDCVKSVYGGDTAALPASQFLAVFGASLLCNYVVSEAYPVAQDFVEGGCEGLQELAYGAPPSTSALMLSQSTSTISSIARSPTDVLSGRTTSLEKAVKVSSTSMSSAAALTTRQSMSDMTSSASISRSPLNAPSSSTALVSLGLVSRTTSASRNLQIVPQPVGTSTNFASPAKIILESASSTTVVQTLGSSLSVSSPLVFAQLAISSEASLSSINSLISIPESLIDPTPTMETPDSVPSSAMEFQNPRSTPLSSESAATPFASPTSRLSATLVTNEVDRSSSTAASTPQAQGSSSLNDDTSQPKSNPSLSSSTHIDFVPLVTSSNSITFASPTLLLNMSSEAVVQSSLRYSARTTSATKPNELSMISSPSSLIHSNNSTTRQTSNWTFANTASFATFLHTTHLKSGNRLVESFSAAPGNSSMSATFISMPFSTSSHNTRNTTHSSPTLTTSIMAPTRVTAIQTVLLTTVVVVMESNIATSTRGVHIQISSSTHTTPLTIQTTRPSSKTKYEGAGGFIAKGFNGLWR